MRACARLKHRGRRWEWFRVDGEPKTAEYHDTLHRCRMRCRYQRQTKQTWCRWGRCRNLGCSAGLDCKVDCRGKRLGRRRHWYVYTPLFISVEFSRASVAQMPYFVIHIQSGRNTLRECLRRLISGRPRALSMAFQGLRCPGTLGRPRTGHWHSSQTGRYDTKCLMMMCKCRVSFMFDILSFRYSCVAATPRSGPYCSTGS